MAREGDADHAHDVRASYGSSFLLRLANQLNSLNIQYVLAVLCHIIVISQQPA